MAKTSPKRPSSVDVAVGRNVRIWRMAKGLSQAQLANQLGITFQQVQKYESGANRIGTGRLTKIAAVLEVPISALFADSDDGADRAGPLLSLVADRRSFRLAIAFAAIKNGGMRVSLVALVERIAASVPQLKRRR
jgi:transcriptional regulator with XRE-family HTH domain